MMIDNYIHLFDTTLRDGAQTQGVDFSTKAKIEIAHALDDLGIDYIEGGWPGANATDAQFFDNPPTLETSKLVSFGMTRRAGRSAENDPVLTAVLQGVADAACLVGKTSRRQVEVALQIDGEENLRMIGDSIAVSAARRDEAMFDAEHFFDGYKEDSGYAVAALHAALENGARWVVLCDTNGGTLPRDAERIVAAVLEQVPGDKLGVHFHNDAESAVANSLLSIECGARQVQGTLNGLGERCGNANLISLIPSIKLKTSFDIGITDDNLARLTKVSRLLDDTVNRVPHRHAAYVGESAFAHKAGLHVSGINRDPTTYEHVAPESVGNRRQIIMSDQAGRANLAAFMIDAGIDLPASDPRVTTLLELIKQKEELEGITYDSAEASFELLARSVLLNEEHRYFELDRFRVIDERRMNAKSEWVTESAALIQVMIGDETYAEAGVGSGPVHALDHAIRKTLSPLFPCLDDMHLADYKVRIIDPKSGTGAKTRVMIESRDSNQRVWRTVGVSANIIDASYQALHDAIAWKIMASQADV